jgi:hypothetical protein
VVHLIHRLSTVSVRRSVTTVQQPAVPAVPPPALPTLSRSEITTVHRSELLAVRRPQVLPVPRPRITALRWLAIAAVLAAAVVLFATVPVWVAHQVIDSGIWGLAGPLVAGVARPDLSSHALPLLLGSIVVLAAMSSSSGPRRHDRW